MAARQTVVGPQWAGMRLDLFVTGHFVDGRERSGLSRSGIQRLIADGQITLNGQRAKSSARLKIDDVIEIQSLPPRKTALEPEEIPLNILYEDRDCIVIDKAPGMVVHPAAGSQKGTLVNALLHHCPHLEGIGGERRPGIVHRLDKDTSGVMIVAKNDFAFQRLARQFKDRRVDKEYLALLWGKLPLNNGIIDRPIGRHRSDRKRMSSLHSVRKTRDAVTEWRVEKSYRANSNAKSPHWISLVRVRLHTGRTHQIRVHFADIGFPVVGDGVYGRKRSKGSNKDRENQLVDAFPRQALHAERLGIAHPRTGERLEFRAPLRGDIQALLKSLENASGGTGRFQGQSGVDKEKSLK